MIGFPALAADLVGRKVDVIVTGGGIYSALAAKGATSTIPIVFLFVGDPVGVDLVGSLARPGGNLTGFSGFNAELMTKLLELLAELATQAGVMALLVNPNNPNTERIIRDVREGVRPEGCSCRSSRQRKRDRRYFRSPRRLLLLRAAWIASSGS